MGKEEGSKCGMLHVRRHSLLFAAVVPPHEGGTGGDLGWRRGGGGEGEKCWSSRKLTIFFRKL